MKDLTAGFRDYWRAQGLLFRKGLWPVFLVPGLLSALYFPLSIVVAFMVMSGAAGYVHDHWVPASLRGAATMWMLAFVLWFAAIYVGFLLFRNVIMILYSPFLSHLSEAAEDRETGRDRQGFDWSEMLASAARGTGMSLLTLAMSLAALALGWGLALVPVIGGLAAVTWMTAAQCYVAGLGFCDPALERRGRGIRATLRHAWGHRGRTLGHGLAFSLLLLIPVAGWFLAPSFGIVAGTLGVIDTEGEVSPPKL